MRGKETPPTKTDERVFQAQLDQLPESGLAITSSAAPVEGGGTHGRKRIGFSSVASPSPRPSPPRRGRGRMLRRPWRPDCHFVVYLADSSVRESKGVQHTAYFCSILSATGNCRRNRRFPSRAAQRLRARPDINSWCCLFLFIVSYSPAAAS